MDSMRRFLVSAAIVSLIAGFPPAFAQDREHHDQQGGQPQGEQHGGPQGGEHHGGGGPRPGPAPQANPGPRGGEHPPGMQNGSARPERPGNPPSNAMRGPAPNNAMRANQSPP